MTTLGFSEISFDESNNNSNKLNKEMSTRIKKSNKKRNKTLKNNNSQPSKKVTNFLNYMKQVEGMGNGGDDSDLADFNPPPKPEITKQPPPVEEDGVDTHIVPQSYNEMEDAPKLEQQYENTYVPYYQNVANMAAGTHNKDVLMKKLNYMIHLLEENKDEKTDNITEELILYMFLGVFIIFIVDSFAKVGRYKR